MALTSPMRVRHGFVVGLCAAALGLSSASHATDPFPFGEELLLDAAPMRPGKRMPGITVARNGDVLIDLWCRSVPGRVELGEASIAIVAAPLTDALPEMQGANQCTPARVQADETLLGELLQSTAWQIERGAVILSGAARLKFKPATN